MDKSHFIAGCHKHTQSLKAKLFKPSDLFYMKYKKKSGPIVKCSKP